MKCGLGETILPCTLRRSYVFHLFHFSAKKTASRSTPGTSASFIFYNSLGWGTKEVPTLVAALEYADKHCWPNSKTGQGSAKLILDFEYNEFTDAEKARLRAAIPKGSTKFEVAT